MGKIEIGGQSVEGGADRMNEDGLFCGCFNHPGYTIFPPVTEANRSSMIASWQAPGFECGNYKSTAEARTRLERGDFIIGDVPFPFPGQPAQSPQHIRIGDASGDTIVVEWYAADGCPTIDEAETGVITNAPAYSFHQANIRQFSHLLPNNPSGPFNAGSQDYKQMMGDGYLSMPGGSSAPDRFARASLMSRDAHTGADGESTVWLACHIMNCFDLPQGLLRNVEAETNTEITEYTLWTGVADTRNWIDYFRSHTDNVIYTMDLSRLNPKGIQPLECALANATSRRTNHALDEQERNEAEGLPLHQRNGPRQDQSHHVVDHKAMNEDQDA